MTKKLSISECINVLNYYHKIVPKNIYKIKRKTNIILNKYVCKLYNKNSEVNQLNILLYPFTFSKNKYLFTNTKKIFIKSIRCTRNISPNSYLSCI